MKIRKIKQLDLNTFEKPYIPDNKSLLVRSSWYLVNAVFFNSSFALLPSGIKSLILKVYGASVGKNIVIKPRVNIKYPWKLTIGSHVWLGEMVWIDNQCSVTIGSNVCISQGAYIFTGNHNWNKSSFDFFCKPVNISSSTWITAFTVIGPGSNIEENTAVLR